MINDDRALLGEGSFDDRLDHRFQESVGSVREIPGVAVLVHQLPSDFELVDGTDVRDIERRRSGLTFWVSAMGPQPRQSRSFGDLPRPLRGP
ncbi:hypothetical protein [Mycolicibacterium setense]